MTTETEKQQQAAATATAAGMLNRPRGRPTLYTPEQRAIVRRKRSREMMRKLRASRMENKNIL
jgi:hypothetical protein